jgi:hypothetical protein
MLIQSNGANKSWSHLGNCPGLSSKIDGDDIGTQLIARKIKYVVFGIAIKRLSPHRTMKFFTAILSSLALAVSTTSATSINPTFVILINFTQPKAHDIWTIGSKQVVKWNTSMDETLFEALNATATLTLEGPSEFGKLFSLSLSLPSPRARRLELFFPSVAFGKT